MNRQEIDALTAALNSAPPLPYYADGKMVYHGMAGSHNDFLVVVVCECWSSAIDARYIAAACNAVPELMADVEQLTNNLAAANTLAALARSHAEAHEGMWREAEALRQTDGQDAAARAGQLTAQIAELESKLTAMTARAEQAECTIHLREWCDDPCELATAIAQRDEQRQRAEQAEADARDVRAWADAVPVASMVRIIDALLMGGQPLQYDMDAAETWAKRQEAQP